MSPRSILRRTLAAAAFCAMLAGLPVSTASAAGPIWPRVCDHMSLQGQNAPQVEKWRSYYRRHPARVRSLLGASEPWLWHIVQAVEARGYPMEIALLPVIESSYNPRARSPGGAEGLWQFVGSTARSHGLRTTQWYDGRRDVIASTDAALDYLGTLHDIFDDWLLALAAYNVGENRLIVEQRRQLRDGGKRDFWTMPLPEETRGHVPRLLGLSQAVCGDPIVLPPIKNAPVTEIVTVPMQIDLQVASEWSGTPLSTLFALNPALNRSATDPDGPHRLIMPIARVEDFKLRMATASASDYMRYDRYIVRAGDTLSQIAARYGSSVAAIKHANELRGNLIKVGHTLVVPREAPAPARRSVPLVAASTTARQQKTEYVVKAGDSLWSLARRFGVSQKDLRAWNDLNQGNTLRIGRKLVIWLPREDSTAAAATTPDA